METFVGCEPSVVNNPRLGVDGHRAVRSGTCGSSTVPSKPNFTDRSAPRVNRLDLFFWGGPGNELVDSPHFHNEQR